jgi:hypothetical protein
MRTTAPNEFTICAGAQAYDWVEFFSGQGRVSAQLRQAYSALKCWWFRMGSLFLSGLSRLAFAE